MRSTAISPHPGTLSPISRRRVSSRTDAISRMRGFASITDIDSRASRAERLLGYGVNDGDDPSIWSFSRLKFSSDDALAVLDRGRVAQLAAQGLQGAEFADVLNSFLETLRQVGEP